MSKLQDKINHLSPELKKQVEDFVDFVNAKKKSSKTSKKYSATLLNSLLSEPSLSKDWLNPKEEKAWAHLQKAR